MQCFSKDGKKQKLVGKWIVRNEPHLAEKNWEEEIEQNVCLFQNTGCYPFCEENTLFIFG